MMTKTTRDAERIGWLLSSAGADLGDSRNALLAGDLDDALEWISRAAATITELKEFKHA